MTLHRTGGIKNSPHGRMNFAFAHPAAQSKWVRGQSQPDRQDDGSLLWNGIFVDISEIKATPKRICFIQKVYAAVIDAEAIQSREPTARIVIQRNFQNQHRTGRMKMAWIGVPDTNTQQLDLKRAWR